jgi:HEPN domain-containing protein
MTPKSPTPYEEVMSFARANSKATQLLMTAAHDYAAARCLLLNGLFAGLPMGAQAIEKFLKAFILLKNPEAQVKGFGHDIPRLLGEADGLMPTLSLSKFSALAGRLNQLYTTRYPDNPNHPQTQDTGEIFYIDELVVYLNENLPCPKNVKYRTGLYTLVLGSKNLTTTPPWETWIKNRNKALADQWPKIEADYLAIMADLYPAS